MCFSFIKDTLDDYELDTNYVWLVSNILKKKKVDDVASTDFQLETSKVFMIQTSVYDLR